MVRDQYRLYLLDYTSPTATTKLKQIIEIFGSDTRIIPTATNYQIIVNDDAPLNNIASYTLSNFLYNVFQTGVTIENAVLGNSLGISKLLSENITNTYTFMYNGDQYIFYDPNCDITIIGNDVLNGNKECKVYMEVSNEDTIALVSGFIKNYLYDNSGFFVDTYLYTDTTNTVFYIVHSNLITLNEEEIKSECRKFCIETYPTDYIARYPRLFLENTYEVFIIKNDSATFISYDDVDSTFVRNDIIRNSSDTFIFMNHFNKKSYIIAGASSYILNRIIDDSLENTFGSIVDALDDLINGVITIESLSELVATYSITVIDENKISFQLSDYGTFIVNK